MSPSSLRTGVLAVLVIAGWVGPAGPAAAQDTTVNFISAQNDDVFEPVISAFEAANPDIEVVHQTVPFDDLNTAVETRVGAGDGSIDVYAADTPRIPSFASKGYLENVDDVRDRIEAAADNDVEMTLVSHEGSVWAYPMWTSTQLLYFNRALLEEAGVELPGGTPDERLTWETVVADAGKAQDAGAEWGLMFQQVDRYYQLQPLFESAGAGSGLTGDDLLTPELTSDSWIRTAQWYGNLFESGLAPRGIDPSQTDDLFAQGEVAYFVGGPWAIGRFKEVEDLDWGVAPHPYFADGKPVTPTGAWALGINPSADNKEAARKFAEFATLTREGAFLTTENFPLPPVNQAAFADYSEAIGELTPTIGPAIDIMSHELAETAVPRPRTTGFVAFETEMNRVFSDIRNGADAAESLEQAQTRLARMLPRQR